MLPSSGQQLKRRMRMAVSEEGGGHVKNRLRDEARKRSSSLGRGPRRLPLRMFLSFPSSSSTSSARNPFLVLVALLTVLVRVAEGMCIVDGLYFPNQSTWHLNACQTCTCHGWVSTCQTQKCFAPECDPGVDLILVPDQCCPLCRPHSMPCLAGDDTYEGLTLQELILQELILQDLILHELIIQEMTLHKLILQDLTLQEVSGYDTSGADTSELILQELKIQYLILQEWKLQELVLEEVILQELIHKLTLQIDTSGVITSGADISGADIPGAGNSGYDTSGVIASGVDTSGTGIPGAGTYNSGSDTSEVDTSGTEKSGFDHLGNDTSGHGERWTARGCEECTCINGTVSCGRQACHVTSCPQGQVALQEPDQCCPECVPVGRSCKYDGEIHLDGDIWSPVPCSQCVCRDGLTQCHVAACPHLSCPTNHTIEAVEGSCCPSCQGDSCIVNGSLYKSGEQWEESPCRTCACVAGRVTCHQQQCPALECQPGDVEVVLEGECCPRCVREEGWCHDGGDHPDGDFWNATACSFCSCRDGSVSCTEVQCQEHKCGPTEQLLQLPGSCCPKCHIDLTICFHEGLVKKSGDVWSVGCGLCKCDSGTVQCFRPLCPSCPEGFLPVASDPTSCCPQCEPVQCRAHCAICAPDGKGGACVACQQGHLLQDGECVDHCSPGFYARGGRCVECHESCSTCRGATPFHCTQCAPDQFLKSGECVQDCGRGFFASTTRSSSSSSSSSSSFSNRDDKFTRNKKRMREGEPGGRKRHGVRRRGRKRGRRSLFPDEAENELVEDDLRNGSLAKGFEEDEEVVGRMVCIECHSSCEECSGTRGSQCLACPTHFFLHQSQCLEKCPTGFLARDRECVPCPRDCGVCGVGECLECYSPLWLQDGECLPRCLDGYYAFANQTCRECHSTCRTCEGPGPASCLSCPPYLHNIDNRCVAICPRGTFAARNGSCGACHDSCVACLGPGHNECLECQEPGKVLVPHDGAIGECHSACPSGHTQIDFVCVPSPPGCQDWNPEVPTVCQACHEDWRLQQGICVQECHPGFYPHPTELRCVECDTRCLTCSGPNHDECLSCPPEMTLKQRSSGAQCVDRCRRRHYTDSAGECQACDPSCHACVQDPTNISASLCAHCREPLSLAEGSVCVATCSPGYFESHTPRSTRCRECYFSCLTCEGEGPLACTSCPEGFTLTQQGSCEEHCPRGTYRTEDGLCTICSDASCATCSEDGASCTSCPPSLQLLFGRCVDKCPEMFFSDEGADGECRECHWTCGDCLGPEQEDCLSCAPNVFRQNNACVAQCPSGYFAEGIECQQCPPGCSQCNGTFCTSCRPPYLLQGGQCHASCPQGSFANIWDHTCHECNANCQECSMFECERCLPSYWLEDGKCVSECRENYFPDPQKGLCLYNLQPPSIGSPMPLLVEYGIPLVLNSSMILIHDPDTDPSRLRVTLIEEPSNGELRRVSSGRDHILQKGDSFTAEELLASKMSFHHSTSLPFSGYMTFSVSDGQFESNPAQVHVEVVSWFEPTVVVNEPLIVLNGHSVSIGKENLFLRDADNPEAVRIRVVEGPRYGYLTIAGEEDIQFTLEELSQGIVTYSHLGSSPNTTTTPMLEMIVLQATDGYTILNFVLKIYIVDEVRSTPVLVRNTGARVREGSRLQLTPQHLQARDVDTADDNLMYALLPTLQNPGQGSLILIIPLPPAPDGFYNDGWVQMDETHLLRPTTSFTQRDINEGRVWYVHSGEMDIEQASDQLLFSVADSSQPPNVLTDQAFVIQVNPSDESNSVAPAPGVQLGITVLAGQAVTIAPNHLSFAGSQTQSSEHLVYTITHPLSPTQGSLFHIDSPGLELRQFTQADIDDMKIIYMPPLGDIGKEERVYSFKFTVADEMKGESNRLPEQKFTIRVIPLRGPNLTFQHPNPEISVMTRESILLDLELFELNNADSEDEITYMLLEPPLFGSILREVDGETFLFTEDDSFEVSELPSIRLLYAHDGGEGVNDWAVFMALGAADEASTRFHFKIQYEDRQQPTRALNATFALTMKEGETRVISSQYLHFTDFHSNDEDLIYTLSSQPKFGIVALEDDEGGVQRALNETDKLSQSHVLAGMLTYTASTEVGLGPILESLVFNVTDPNNNVLSNQVLKITIEGVDNQKPLVRVGEPVVVAEGGSVVLPATCLQVDDPDTPPERLTVVLDAQPIFGFLVSTGQMTEANVHSGGTQPLLDFPLAVLLSGGVTYVQSQHRHQEPLQDSLVLHVSDGANVTPLTRLNITIEPMNDEAPVILGEQVVVDQGQTVIIRNVSLFISDADTEPENLIITVQQPPAHGSIHKKASIDSTVKQSKTLGRGHVFSFRDISDELIFYTHDGSRNPSDFMEIMVSDRQHETGGIVEFLVARKPDEAPQLKTNQGLTLKAGESLAISPKDLLAEDADSETPLLKYVVTRLPAVGDLQVYQPRQEKWASVSVGMFFTQKDLLEGNVRFAHHHQNNPTGTDILRFNLQDPEGNMALDQTFEVTVEEDLKPPRITINEGLYLDEGTAAPITAELLSATDSEIDPMRLLYVTTQGPTHGLLELESDPGTAVTSWLQEDLEVGALRYRHLQQYQSLEDVFTFIVTDGYNNASQSFRITILPVDDALPHLNVQHVKAQGGTRKTLSPYEMEAVDEDTTDEKIMFKVVKPPEYGKIQMKKGDKFVDVKAFSMLDVYEGHVSYLHDGANKPRDAFEIVVNDQSNDGFTMGEDSTKMMKGPAVVEVEVSAMDDGMPLLKTNVGLFYLEQIDNTAKRMITSNELRVEDEDTNPDQLKYEVTVEPRHGVLRLSTLQRPVSSFTQADIDNNLLYYELTTMDEAVSTDSFTFNVADSKPNVVRGNTFHIQWTWIFMGQKEYNLSEAEVDLIRVQIRRTGNIKHYSSVVCSTHHTGRDRPRRVGHHEDENVPHRDFEVVTHTIEFGEGATERYCEIPVYDDSLYEGSETFRVRLSEPSRALLGRPRRSSVTVHDEEDKPQISFESRHFAVNETEGFVFARLRRTGDPSIPVSVLCLSEDGSATGTEEHQTVIEEDADYIARPFGEEARVVFPPNVTISTCDIRIIDDTVFETSEELFLIITEPSEGASLGSITTTTLTIKGPNDLSTVAFSRLNYTVSETESVVSVAVERDGPDVEHSASVWCATRPTDPEEATPSMDFVPQSQQVTFLPGERHSSCSINLIDDKANPRLEGPERFVVFLSTAQNAALLEDASEVEVTIEDEEDTPTLQFGVSEVKVRENETIVTLPAVRTGDLSRVCTARCVTRQRSAKAGLDFIERPNTDDSIITFPKGVSRVECEVGLLNDLIYEKEEEFIVKMFHPESPSDTQPRMGKERTVRVTIVDWEDRPRISLENSVYTVAEPRAGSEAATTTLEVPLMRMGDISQVSRVLITTRDGTAQAGTDYVALHHLLEFGPGDVKTTVDIDILYSPARQWHQTFSVVLEPESPVNADLGAITSATVTILDHEASGNSVLPAPPVVVSLLHYDNAAEHLEEMASPGYPLVCVTPCDLKYPDILKTGNFCTQAGLDDASISYSWEVAVPGDGEGLLTPFHSLTEDTIFASPKEKVLDSMFFARHFRVRCVAQPVRGDGQMGIPLRSDPITVGTVNGICQTPLQPGQPGGFQSQSFVATLSYINATSEDHPNTVRIHVEVPHQDGMVPLVSTLPIHNLRHLLTERLYRAHHSCSNMDPTAGFLDLTWPSQFAEPSRPYQWDSNLRQNKTLALYSHLDLSSCMWTFDAWLSMSQLVDRCGGQVVSDFQVGSGGQSFLTVRLPLYVSYVYAASPPGWASLDHRTELSVSLYYNTLLWHQGLHTQPSLTARIQITRISIDESGRLVIDLRTVAKFRGQFVLRHPVQDELESALEAPEDLDIKFTLELVWSASTWDGPEQVWRATSDYNLKDYTGEYSLLLIPCTVTPTQSYEVADPPPCTPHTTPTEFVLPIAIQQTYRPVPLVYTLNTDLQLVRSKEELLADPYSVDNLEEVDYKGRYGPDETIYGRVLWHPTQDLHSAYQLSIQQVFLCTGRNGYVPTYDPTGELYNEGPQYGCIQPSSRLQHRFLILDRDRPGLYEGTGENFDAYLAEDLADLSALREFSGVDGFVFSTNALYRVNSGHQWYIQVSYTIGPRNRRNKREAEEPFHSVLLDMGSSSMVSLRQKRGTRRRPPGDSSPMRSAHNRKNGRPKRKTKKRRNEAGEKLPIPAFLQSLHVRNGTNMRGFELEHEAYAADSSVFLNVLWVILALICLLALTIAGILVARRYFRGQNGFRDPVIIVRNFKNEREKSRRKVDTKVIERSKGPITLNSESNLQTVKVKTLAITVHNNLDQEGTEV
ncbi:extracellular matrix organizing protein FRAS1-like [Oratosquilla oratoria]|uniref:extracellular matrix organizing protein FRAS1-like n=1 Tax=Oratosquilla oratoria TaxID=337810 RepID=UPI003F75CF5B